MEYVEANAAREIPMAGTKYLVPLFVIRKIEANGKEKLRLISDCREVNKVLNPPRFKLDHWKDIFPQLEKGMWATKVDLKNAYFHLQLSEAIKPYIRMKIGKKIPNGGGLFWVKHPPLSLDGSNECVSQKMEKTRSKGFCLPGRHFVGFQVKNFGRKANIHFDERFGRKWDDNKFQKVHHRSKPASRTPRVLLGSGAGFTQGPHSEIKISEKGIRKIFNAKGNELQESSGNFGPNQKFSDSPAMPPGVHGCAGQALRPAQKLGWDKKHPINQLLKDQVVEIGALLKNLEGRSLDSKSPVRKIYSDSSTEGWGALDLTSGQKLQEFKARQGRQETSDLDNFPIPFGP